MADNNPINPANPVYNLGAVTMCNNPISGLSNWQIIHKHAILQGTSTIYFAQIKLSDFNINGKTPIFILQPNIPVIRRPRNLQCAANLADTDAFILLSFFAISTRVSSAAVSGLPLLSPLVLAAVSPAMVCSRISRRSYCASVAKMLKIISPEAVVVSMPPSLRERNPTPLLFSCSTISIRFRRDLPSRSSLQTIRVSPSLSFFRQAFRPGRSAFEPLAWSVKISCFLHPAAFSASSCRCSSYSNVKKRA